MANILIVDDAKIMRTNLKTILTRAGYSIVAEASNGAQAIEEYKKFKPDLVTMDIVMPEMSGIEAASKIVSSSINYVIKLV